MDLPKKFYVRDEQIYIDNFKKVVTEGYHLTTIGFNSISEINSFSYQNAYKNSWLNIVSYMGYEDELYNYLITEFELFIKKTKSKALRNFFSEHPYLRGGLYHVIDKDRITKACGIKRSRRNYSPKELEDNFNMVKNVVGHIPTFNEFKEHTNIGIPSYRRQLKFPNEKYLNIINHYCNDQEIEEYKTRRLEHKSNVGKITGPHFKYDDDSLMFEFIRVFELCYEKYKSYPSTQLFNKLSHIDESVYRLRFNKRWSEICEMYGYSINYINMAETMCLNLIKDITNTYYMPQKTFEWLRGVKDFPLFCDGYFPELNLVVEYDGRQHREPVADFGGEKAFEITSANDEIKNKLIPENGLKFIRISSNDPWYDENYLREVLIHNNIISA